MRYGSDYDRAYTGYGRGPERGHGLGRRMETNWMGRNYRDPGEPPRGYGAPYGARGMAWEERGRGYGGEYSAYDHPYRPLGGMHRGYDRGFRARGGYDARYREPERGWGPGRPWGPYSPYRMLQSRSAHWGSPWPGRFFTDYGHETGPY